MAATKTTLQTIRDAHTTATGSWTGCDWTQLFTQTGIDRHNEETENVVDADGKTAEECKELAGDGETDEQKAWAKAAEYCASCEADAATAEEEGAAALEAAEAGDLDGALKHAETAASTERTYGDAPTWGPLVEAIEAAIETAAE